MDKLFIAEIVGRIKKYHITEDNYKEKIIFLISHLDTIVKNLTKKDLLDTSNAERIRLIEYVRDLFTRRSYIEKFYDDINYRENELLKLFVSELIKYKELNKEIIQIILDNIAKMLLLESQKEENKNLDYPKVKFFANLKVNKDNEFGSIINYLDQDIRIFLDFHFDLKHLNLIDRELINLDKYEFSQIKEIILAEENTETIESEYGLVILKHKLLNDKKANNKSASNILYDLTEDIMKEI